MRRLLSFLFIFLLIGAAPAFSQWRRFGQSYLEPTGYFGIGGSTAVNPVARQLDAGWNINGGAGVTQGYFGVMGDALFTSFGVNHDTLVRAGARSGTQRFWAFTVDPIVHVNPRGPADFYVIAGAGLYGTWLGLRAPAGPASRFDLLQTETHYRFGVNGGAGFSFRVDPFSRVKLFVEARYHHMFLFDQGASFIPVSFGVRF
jgi:hypothetical protein